MCGTNGYVLSAISQRTHGCPQDTRVSHLRRILPHRARPDAARRRTRPPAADATRQRESAGERALRAQSRGKGRTHYAYTAPTLRQLTTGKHNTSRRLGRAQRTNAREHRTTTRDTAQSRRRRDKQPRPRRRRRETHKDKNAREDGQLYKILILYPALAGLVIAACGDYTKFLRDFV